MRRTLLCGVLILWQSLCGLAQALPQQTLGSTRNVTVKLYKLPDNTSSVDRIYLAGPVNGWNPGQAGFEFVKGADSVWSLTVAVPATQTNFEYKVTRGTWASVERDENGYDISNHQVSLANNATRQALKIPNWADRPTPLVSTRVGHIEIHDVYMTSLQQNRKIWIYLPPDYASSVKSYPVLYMYDAQNLFDRKSAPFDQEWRVDESLQELFYENLQSGMIVVALDNSSRRACEYNVFAADPHPYCPEGSALGSLFNDFIALELRPWVDAHYRSIPDREHRAVMGSSMGGQMALSMGLRYPDLFAQALALSPSYQNQLSARLWMPDYIRSLTATPPLKVYQDLGDSELIRDIKANVLQSNMFAVQAAIRSLGVLEANNQARVIPGAVHNEQAWSLRFKELARGLWVE